MRKGSIAKSLAACLLGPAALAFSSPLAAQDEDAGAGTPIYPGTIGWPYYVADGTTVIGYIEEAGAAAAF